MAARAGVEVKILDPTCPEFRKAMNKKLVLTDDNILDEFAVV